MRDIDIIYKAMEDGGAAFLDYPIEKMFADQALVPKLPTTLASFLLGDRGELRPSGSHQT